MQPAATSPAAVPELRRGVGLPAAAALVVGGTIGVVSGSATSEPFAAQAGRVLAAIVALSVLGSLFAFMTTTPRVYYAMARAGVMPAFVARLDPRTGAPSRAIAIQASLAALLVAFGTFDAIVAYFVFATVVFLAWTVVGLQRLRRREPPRGYATPLYPVPPILFLTSAALVLLLLAAGRSKESALGLGVVSLGVPVYSLLKRREGGTGPAT